MVRQRISGRLLMSPMNYHLPLNSANYVIRFLCRTRIFTTSRRRNKGRLDPAKIRLALSR